ncbi:MAG: hypothetical protein CVT89_02710 [Candidatus Altiarchaeales archaeon HGW-Altiarchaeales-2]|nr:MAG: hypothetical protein CVT89_02710 [Candidatus Altiarchaeales archaeon HGW-Altiarchaeales-2]
MENFADACKKSAAELADKNKTVKTTVENGVFVEVAYIGKLTNGTKFDNGTVKFTVGGGQMIKGFDKGVVGMKTGESKDLVIPPEDGYGLPETSSKIFPQEIPIGAFKTAFNNEEPVKGKEYTNLNSLPWPVKVIDVKVITHNYTIKILNILTKEEYKNMSCLGKYGISENDVVFLYSDSCGWCAKMKPLVETLEKEGYSFSRINVADGEKMNIGQECLSNMLDFSGGVPQFTCPATGKYHGGAFTKPDGSADISQLRAFADECNKSA